MAASTLHLRVLNPHLDHQTFDAVYVSEHTKYKYNSGHCQVSSFGVGGTNGHAIFWGEQVQAEVDYRKVLMRKIMKAAPPILNNGSTDPSKWEYQGLDPSAKIGDEYQVVLEKDPVTGEETVSFEKTTDDSDRAEFYSTTGNHNDWSNDQMTEGDVPGLFYQEIPVPESGTLEFRILADGLADRNIGPEETTSQRLAKIKGPDPKLRTSWLVDGTPGAIVRVEFLVPQKGIASQLRSISWLSVSDVSEDPENQE
eukprot:TRINITY_DN4834_c0_g1_i1.p1 TRINITY_DN4834_c0_g1~~TRINITY_DN4834_c0_g1_i1.p1  ORF type:complete len:281 (+),score=51.87 TRINITY_DN4834_c0_g1_i1:83-844(+)